MTALDKRLDTGMTVGEALRRAEQWWDATGRKLTRREMVERNATKRHPSREAFVTPDAWSPSGNFLPSGILQGKPWADLTKAEMSYVTRVWHHQFVRLEQDGGHVWNDSTCVYCGMIYAMWSATRRECEAARRIVVGLEKRRKLATMN